MILLDTNAALFLIQGHRRAKALLRHSGQLAFSPFALLELQFLVELGKVRMNAPLASAVRGDPRWVFDEPPLNDVVEEALSQGWTRDPFDRLIVSHALTRRWRLATSDGLLAAQLGERNALPL